MILPGIVPRLRAFARDGFGWVAFLMAMTYQGARLLPAAHPYCNPANMGRFGIRHVIAEAANNLVLSRRNIDQIIIFIAMLTGFVLLAAQVVLLLASVIIGVAHAGGTAPAVPGPFAGMFNTPDPQTDIALMLLAHVFGVPGLFCNSGGACPAINETLPTPFHQGLHALLEFYSLAILLVGVLILLYYVVVTVGETAQTGTPFGRRFSHIWAPIRLVVAVGLLVPINYGLNSAQYITLIAARMGSGFATNGWHVFVRQMANPTGQEASALIALPTPPDGQYILQFMMLVQACRYGYALATVPPTDGGGSANMTEQIEILPYFVDGPRSQRVPDDPFGAWEQGNTFYNNNDIVIRFGHYDPQKYPHDEGQVKSYCGEITVHRVDTTLELARLIAQAYTAMIMFAWEWDDYRNFGMRAAVIDSKPTPKDLSLGAVPAPPGQLPNHAWKQQVLVFYQGSFQAQVPVAYETARNQINFEMPQEILSRGWGGAGIWYNRIAQWNGAWIGAVRSVPTPTKMPWPMEQVQAARRGQAANVDSSQRFSPEIQGQPVRFEKDEEWEVAVTLNKVYNYWYEDGSTEASDLRDTGNAFRNTISMIFGLDGLFTIREGHHIHPLAQMVALGKGIVDASVRNLFIALGAATISGGAEQIQGSVAKLAAGVGGAATSLFLTFATIGLTVGFVLFYVLPFMPFMYFFFAVGAWVKTVFEAMVGVPLWALAHLRIDGNGLPGEAAMNGYFLIFEIFVRPILTVFGLLASLAIFTAMVKTLHEIFPLVTQNMTGFNSLLDGNNTAMQGLTWTALGTTLGGWEYKRDPVDTFFFTVIYTILVYMIGTSSFKLIDQIPSGILRWLGSGARTFNSGRDDPIGNLVQYAAIGGSSISSQVTGAMVQGARGAGSTAGAMFETLTGSSRLASRMTRGS